MNTFRNFTMSLCFVKNSCSAVVKQVTRCVGFLPLLSKTLCKGFCKANSSEGARVVLAFQQEQQMC